jgi:hypothetical protein
MTIEGNYSMTLDTPKVWMAAMTPGVSALSVTTSKEQLRDRRAQRQKSPRRKKNRSLSGRARIR